MAQLPDRMTTIIVTALRRDTTAIRETLENANNSSDEWLVDAIRPTRSLRSTTSLIGSFVLNRVVSQLEALFESIQTGGLLFENEDVSNAALFLLAAIESYIDNIEIGYDCANAWPEGDRDLAIEAVKTFRRVMGSSELDDDQAIQQIFSIPACFAQTAPDTGQTEQRDASSVPPLADDVPGEMTRIENAVPEIWEIFKEEADTHIESMYSALKQLNGDLGNIDRIQDVRRSAHTLKGAAGAVGLRITTQLSHRMEDLLDQLYAGDATLTTDLLDLLHTTTDLLHDLVNGEPGEDGQSRLTHVYDCYTAYVEGQNEPPSQLVAQPVEGAGKREEKPNSTNGANRTTDKPTYTRVSTGRLDDLRSISSELLVTQNSAGLLVEQMNKRANDLNSVLNMLRELLSGIEQGREENHEQFGPVERNQDSSIFDSSEFDELEFDRFTRLDLWSHSVQEVISALAAVRHDVASLMDDCQTKMARQNRLLLDTQRKLVQIQLVPIQTIVPRLDRAVREAASQANKEVDLFVEGNGIELDKTVMEQLVEPLTHLLRNAVDHGVENAAVRREKGKSAQSQIRIALSNFGPQILLRVIDDGAGLCADKIRTKAVARGILEANRADELSGRELYPFIFEPGFSTAESVSQISGRGVGMDIVRNRIESLQGRIDIESREDQGTTFTIRLPVSQTTTKALMLTAADRLFAIPQDVVSSVSRFKLTNIVEQNDGPHVELNDLLLPLINLRDYCGLDWLSDHKEDTMLVAIINSGGKQLALHVDGILPGRDIVIQPLANKLARSAGLLGSTILSNGVVVPVLDPTDILNCGVSLPESPHRTPAGPSDGLATVMIVEDSRSVRRVLKSLIEHEGWTAVPAHDGVDALEKLPNLETPPDVFLLDVEMPRMSGFELLEKLRREAAFANTPVIMITSRSGEKHRKQAMDLGATNYVSKPFQHDQLVDLIAEHLAARV